MATLKRQKADGSWEFIEVVGMDIINALADKVDKETGKGLSTIDFTDLYRIEVDKVKNKADKSYVDNKVKTDVPLNANFNNTEYTAGSNISIVDNVINATGGDGGEVTKESVGLGNVDNIKQMPINNGTLESYSEKLITVAGTSPVLNLSLGNTFIHSITGNTTYSITNAKSGVAHSMTLRLSQSSIARDINFPTSVKWGKSGKPDMSTPNKSYILTFLTVDGGINWEGMFGGEF